MPLISVIIPCYNAADYIDRCLTSVFEQSIGYHYLEVICIDDASTDDTLQKLNSWEQKYPQNMLLIPCDENMRQGHARNLGLSYATAEWIGFLDADDWIESDYFKQLYHAATSFQVDMAVCGFTRDFSCSSMPAVSSRKPDWHHYIIDTTEKRKTCIRFMSQNPSVWGRLIRREFLFQNNIFFPEHLAYEDNIFTSLVYAHTYAYCQTELPLYHYYVNDNSTILKVNENYHIDFLTIQCRKWQEWLNREFYPEYKAELEFDFLHSCYLDFLKIVCLRYDPPSFSLFLLLRETILSYIPDYQQNPYYEQGFTDFQHLLLEALSLPVSRSQFEEIAGYIKKIGI